MAGRADRFKNQENDAAPRRDAEAQIREAEIENALGSEALIEPDPAELEDLAAELGMQEVVLDQAVIDTIAADTENRFDTDDDGVEDDTSEEIIDDRPQILTQSYGTGLQGQPSDRAGTYSRQTDDHVLNQPDATLTGGDVDADPDDADAVGEESVGGTAATPDQDVVDELAVAVGVELNDRSYLRVNEMLEQRDDRRWELDPKSSEDYEGRQDEDDQ